MRRIGADQSWFSCGLIRSKVPTYIAGREIQGAKASNLHVRKIVAHSSPLAKSLFRWRPDVGHLRVEAKVGMNACSQIEKCLGHGPPRDKRLQRIGSKLRPYANARRFKNKLICIETCFATIRGERLGHLFPRWRFQWLLLPILGDDDFAASLNNQFLVRLLNGEEAEAVSKVVDPFGTRRWSWLNE